MLKTYQFRLLPTGQQVKQFEDLLVHTCRLYNLMLGMRIEAYKRGGHGQSLYEQQNELTHLRRHNPVYAAVWRQFQQGVPRRLDRAYQGFYRRVKSGEKAGFPRYQSLARWRSLEIPQALVYKHGEVRIKGLGAVRVIARRVIEGKIKNAAIKRDAHGWRITIVAECCPKAYPAPQLEAVGIDLGLSAFFTDSNGDQVENGRYLQRSLRHLRISQRALQRKGKGSRRHRQCTNRVRQAHWKVAERRRGFHWNTIYGLLCKARTIVVEDLQVKTMARNRRLSRAIMDAGWSGFISRLVVKAEEAGRQVIKAAPHGTSQVCSGCGRVVAKALSQRVHSCVCGVVLDRDHNAALNILRRAGISPPVHKVTGCRELAPMHSEPLWF